MYTKEKFNRMMGLVSYTAIELYARFGLFDLASAAEEPTRFFGGERE